jgi:hypothetical protein
MPAPDSSRLILARRKYSLFQQVLAPIDLRMEFMRPFLPYSIPVSAIFASDWRTFAIALGVGALISFPRWLAEMARAWDAVDRTAGRIRKRHLRNKGKRAAVKRRHDRRGY